MSAEQDLPLPEIGSQIVTACKSAAHFQPSTPSAIFRGRRIYFCDASCLEDFKADPENSCLTSHSLPSES